MQKFNFELLTSHKSPNTNTAFISINQDGFRFSPRFLDEYSLREYDGVKIFLDKNENVLAFKFCKVASNGETNGERRLRPIGNSRVVRTSSIISLLDKDSSKYANRYIPQKYMDKDAGEMFILELKSRSIE